MDAKQKAVALALATSIAVPMEGLRQYAYRDPVGLPTICFGSTKGVKMGDFRTVPECKELLTKEMSDVISRVDSCRPGLPPTVLASFSDAGFNIGEHIACDSNRSTAARYLAAGNYVAACNELPKWNKATVMGAKVVLPGLTKRRELERELCLS
jgi:lysozyme